MDNVIVILLCIVISFLFLSFLDFTKSRQLSIKFWRNCIWNEPVHGNLFYVLWFWVYRVFTFRKVIFKTLLKIDVKPSSLKVFDSPSAKWQLWWLMCTVLVFFHDHILKMRQRSSNKPYKKPMMLNYMICESNSYH